MPELFATTYKDHADLMDTMENTVLAIKAFNTLLERSLRDSEDMSDDGYGIWLFLDRQRRDLDELAVALRNEYAELKTSKLEIRNSERIAEWAGTTKYVVNRVISIATGIDLGPPTERHTEQKPYYLKEKLGETNGESCFQ